MSGKSKGTGPILPTSELVVRVLNADDAGHKASRTAADVAKSLQKLMLRMKSESISEDGSQVDYKKIKKSKLFKEYCDIAVSLRLVDLDTLNEKQKIAFFINVYNALTIHGLVECDDLPTSVLKIKLFWKTTSYIIAGYTFSLDDIEHGILRGNLPHPASSKKPFEPTDPRLKYAVKKLDPRIHFTLVCGAKSCPVINVYTEENLDKAMEDATRNFCSQEIRVYEIQREIHISKVFQWYKSDFGQNDLDALRWTFPFLSPEKRDSLRRLLHLLENQGMVDLKYRDYNWALNCVPEPEPTHLSQLSADHGAISNTNPPAPQKV